MLVEALDQESSVECCRLLVPLQRWIPWQAKNIDNLTNRGYGYPVKPGMTDRLLLCHPRPGMTDRLLLCHPRPGMTDRLLLCHPRPGMTDRLQLCHPRPGMTDRLLLCHPRPGMTDRLLLCYPRPGMTDRLQLCHPRPGMTDRLQLCHPRPDRGSMAKVLATLSDAMLQIALLYQNCPLLRLRLVGGLKSLGLS
jgi:hypothetical protein